jgi:hypothetical protein
MPNLARHGERWFLNDVEGSPTPIGVGTRRRKPGPIVLGQRAGSSLRTFEKIGGYEIIIPTCNKYVDSCP